MNISLTRFGLAAVVAACAGSAASQVSFTLIGQAILPFDPMTGNVDPTGTGFRAWSTSADGTRIVGNGTQFWDETVGGLPASLDAATDYASLGLGSITNDGSTIFSTMLIPETYFPFDQYASPPNNPGADLIHCGFYDIATGTWTPIPLPVMDDGMGGTVPFADPLGVEISGAWAVSGDGSTAVGYANGIPATTFSRPFAYDGTINLALENFYDPNVDPIGLSGGRASAVSDDGSVIGGFRGSRLPMVWVNGVATPLPGIGEVEGVSSNGQYMTGIANVDSNRRDIALWTSDGNGGWDYRKIPSGPAGSDARGLDVSNDGKLIVGFSSAGGFIWTPGTGVMFADDYLDLIGITRPDVTSFDLFDYPFSVDAVTDITPDGNTIIGWGGAEPDGIGLLSRSFKADIVRSCGYGDFALPFQTLNTDDNIEMLTAVTQFEARADINSDSALNFLDVIEHLRAYDEGCN